jgi:hypothetical protein
MRFLVVAVIFAAPTAVGAFILYWVIRLAVRHALEDTDLRRAAQARAAQARTDGQWDPARTR